MRNKVLELLEAIRHWPNEQHQQTFEAVCLEEIEAHLSQIKKGDGSSEWPSLRVFSFGGQSFFVDCLQDGRVGVWTNGVGDIEKVPPVAISQKSCFDK